MRQIVLLLVYRNVGGGIVERPEGIMGNNFLHSLAFRGSAD
jgi:hypothetical protein